MKATLNTSHGVMRANELRIDAAAIIKIRGKGIRTAVRYLMAAIRVSRIIP